ALADARAPPWQDLPSGSSAVPLPRAVPARDTACRKPSGGARPHARRSPWRYRIHETRAGLGVATRRPRRSPARSEASRQVSVARGDYRQIYAYSSRPTPDGRSARDAGHDRLEVAFGSLADEVSTCRRV